jgi:hypothetical protein
LVARTKIPAGRRSERKGKEDRIRWHQKYIGSYCKYDKEDGRGEEACNESK